MAPTPDDRSTFSSAWDRYVDEAKNVGQAWPGDDWGDESLWDGWSRRLLLDHGAAGWKRAVEVGQGTGKYTARLFAAAPDCSVLACDVSERFLDLCRQRLAAHVEDGRLTLRRVAEDDPDALSVAVDGVGWSGSVDGFFSIDTLVHLTFTQVVAVMLQSTTALREGGVLAFTFACGTSEAGRAKMIGDLDRVIRAGADPTTGCFHWVSPELVSTTAEAIGFDVVVCDIDPLHRRDGHFVGCFADPEKARAARSLRSTG